MKDIKKLSGKSALITGAGRGVGRATAILFAEEGANLILIARTAGELEETERLCLKNSTNIFTRTIDLARESQIDNLIGKLPDDFTPIDILVNNASRFDSGPMSEYGIDDLKMMLQVNLLAPFYLSQKVIAMMNKETGGSIVNVSSFSGCFGVEKFPGFGAYNISKYALWGLTEILALECREKNIRVNQIAPSGVDTQMFREAVPPGVEPDLTPEEVARQILYLASGDSYPLTGANIMIDGMPKDEQSD